MAPSPVFDPRRGPRHAARIASAALVSSALMLVAMAPVAAQSVVVEQIVFRGSPVGSAGSVKLIAPGSVSAQSVTLQLGRVIAPGTDIATPAGVALVLVSEAGNRFRLAPDSRVRLSQGPALAR
ncbi:MAG: hypothetical protein R3E68_07515 [Burkholderiaceae bacterium]